MGILSIENSSITGSGKGILQTQLQKEPACRETGDHSHPVQGSSAFFQESWANHVLMAFLLPDTDRGREKSLRRTQASVIQSVDHTEWQ